MNITKPAICCIGYNRPNSMRRLLSSLANAIYDDTDITLIISIDKSDKSDEIIKVAECYDWQYGEKRIVNHAVRMGLRDHCLECGDYAIEFGSVIFLEDDVVVAPGFYRFAKNAVEFYNDNDKIIGISLYSEKWVYDLSIDFLPAHNGFDTFMSQRELSHGQCWTKKGWMKFREWYNRNRDTTKLYDKRIPPCVYQWNPQTSWSRFMSFFMVEYDMYYVCPYHSYATNMSEVGIHASHTTDICQIPLTESRQVNFRFPSNDESIYYDAFYERIKFTTIKINGTLYENICIDLNGKKYDWSGYDYILTTKSLPYDVIRTYGINMDPIENNIIYSVPGEGIFLYKIPGEYELLYDQNTIHSVPFSSKRIEHIFNKYPLRVLKTNLFLRYKERLRSFLIKIK